MDDNDTLAHFMTKSPLNVQLSTTVANCAHMMIWEGIELLPVISPSKN